MLRVINYFLFFMAKNLSKNLFGFASGLVVFAMLFSPSASIVRYVSAEEISVVVEEVREERVEEVKEEVALEESAELVEAPVVETEEVETPVIIEEPIVDDAFICSVENTPVITVPQDYFEYTYGTPEANLLLILGDLNFGKSISDPDEDAFIVKGEFVAPFMVGGLNPGVGVYTYRHTATDIDGCVGTKDITIVINPNPAMVCNAETRPVISTTEEIYRYPSNVSLFEVLGDFENFYTVSDPDHSNDLLKNDSAFINDLSGGLTIDDGDYVYRVSYMDPTGCRGEKDFIVRVGPDPVVNNGGGGNGGGGNSSGSSSNNGGSVLGATTSGEVLGVLTCDAYFSKFMRKGYSANETEEVKKLQNFLNTELGLSIPNTGFFGPMTDAGVKQFQSKYASEILSPWGAANPTGLFYKTTMWKANMLMCDTLNAPVPTDLVPFSQYVKSL